MPSEHTTGVLSAPSGALLVDASGALIVLDVHPVPPREPTEPAGGALSDPPFARRIARDGSP